MSLFADICRNEDWAVTDASVTLDESTKLWTVLADDYLEEPIPGIPTKEMALAIARALHAAYDLGYQMASEWAGWS